MITREHLNVFVMKKYVIGFLALVSFYGCQSTSQEKTSETNLEEEETLYTGDNSRVSLDWMGMYMGYANCKDCDSIKTIVTLESDDTFSVTNQRFPGGNKSSDTGKIEWFEDGSGVRLTGKLIDMKLVVGEGRLLELNDDGNLMDSTEQGTHIYFKIE